MVDDETTGAPNLIIGGAHTLKAFDQSLSELVTLIVDMGIHVSSMVEKSVQVFLDRDTAAANQLIQDDLQVDNLKNAIISRTLDALVRHQPVASDLRLVLAIEHIAGWSGRQSIQKTLLNALSRSQGAPSLIQLQTS